MIIVLTYIYTQSSLMQSEIMFYSILIVLLYIIIISIFISNCIYLILN